MSAEEIIKKINEMDNGEKIELLHYLYHTHYNRLSDKDKQILSDYYNGRLVEVEDHDEY